MRRLAMKKDGSSEIIQGISRRDFIKKTSLAAGGLVLAGATGLPIYAATPQRGGVYKFSTNRVIHHLNPVKAKEQPEYLLSELMYSGLTKLDEKMNVVPDLAVSWEASKDARKWVYKLRKGVEFHNGGGEVSAHDVVATYEHIRDKKNGATGRKMLKSLDTIKALDKYTVELTCNAPNALLPPTLSYPSLKIVPKKILENNYEQLALKGCGSGPFLFKEFIPGTHLLVERNPNYFTSGRPYLDGVKIVTYPDSNSEINAFKNGQLDALNEVLPSHFIELSKMDNIVTRRKVAGTFLNIILGCDTAPFNDMRARQALAMCIDRQMVVDMVLEGYGSVGNDTPISPAYLHYKEFPQKEQDIAKAADLMRAAGVKKGTTMTLVASNKPSLRAKLGVVLKENAREIGFNINIKQMDHSSYLKQVWCKGNFYVGYYSMKPAEDMIFSRQYTSDAPWNEARWNNKEFDRLIDQARGEVDLDKQGQLYGKAQELCYEQVPQMVPLFMDLLAAHGKYVHNHVQHPCNQYWFSENIWMDKA
jgi:peptide/nickel transport system substrate-binding protein